MADIGAIYEKVNNGNPLSDEELDAGIVFFRDLQLSLCQLGPVFQLAAEEAGRAHQWLYEVWGGRKREIMRSEK